MSRNSRVYLTGFMGSGKSTIGPILANSLGWSFIDVDKAVEQSTGRSILQIFEDEGEEGFRNLERAMIHDTESMTNTVIALGGGAITGEETFQQITRSGILVYLRVDREDMMKRLGNKARRPLLSRNASHNAFESTIDSLFRARERFYAMADIVVTTGNVPVGRTVDELVRKLAPLIGS